MRVALWAAAGAAGVIGLAAERASATWSIIIADTRTGEVAVASCTCLTGFDLQANTPVLLAGIGGATAQSSVDADGVNRVFIRDRLLEGQDPTAMLGGLAVFDAQHQTRQYGIVDVRGRAATFSGTGAGGWKGGRTGQVGTIVYAVQGNVLSGSPVVDKAVEAIENTTGDVPAKLMASMEAARQYGGDGRCSCSAGAPESCGPTPPSFTKASHIGYMLIARAGDRDGSNSIYRVSRTPLAAAVADFNGDGRADLAVPGSNGHSVTVLLGEESRAGALKYLQVGDTPTGTNPRDIAVADFNGDGKLDIATANGSANSLSLLLGAGDGHFTPTTATPLGDGGPTSMVTADFDGVNGPDLAVTINGGSAVRVLLNKGSGSFTQQTVVVGSTPNGIAVADDDGDSDLDLYVACTGSQSVQILRNAGGVFTAQPAIPVGAGAWSAAPVDLDADGDMDLAVVATTAAQVRVLVKGSTGYAAPVTYAVGTQPWHVVASDMTADGKPDLLVANRGGRTVSQLRGRGDGTFDPATTIPVGFQCQKIAVADLDGDADDDLVLVQSSGHAVNALENFAAAGTAARFQDISGCATGDYFMEFNVPFQTAADPDPVFTLRSRYDAWRAGLVGVTDAVQSEAMLDRAVAPADGTSTAVLTVRPRDWQLSPVSASSVVVEAVSGPAVAVGSAVMQPDGSFRAVITAGAECGEAELMVTVSAGGREVILMPSVTLGLAPPADLTGDGIVDFGDYLEFLNLFGVQDARVDFTRDGIVDFSDYLEFLNLFGTAC